MQCDYMICQLGTELLFDLFYFVVAVCVRHILSVCVCLCLHLFVFVFMCVCMGMRVQ